MSRAMERIEHRACFGGWQDVYRHGSEVLGCTMNFAVYLPPQAAYGPCPVLYWLSGLTCTEQNFITKAGAQRYAAEHGIILVAPDTSPRGDEVADAEGYDLGKGAGFYLNATQAPWAAHYRMHEYVVEELPALIEAHFPTTGVRAISGHSMGGHGALTLALRHPGRFQSLSAFAPICAPTQCPWGERAFTGYLGADRMGWIEHDATVLMQHQPVAPYPAGILIDQGLSDKFLADQLHPHLFEAACQAIGQPLSLRRHAGYDHGYYFIQTFMADHLRWHAERLAR